MFNLIVYEESLITKGFNPNPPVLGVLPPLHAHENPISRRTCAPTGCDGWQIIMREAEMTLFISTDRKHVAQTGFLQLRRKAELMREERGANNSNDLSSLKPGCRSSTPPKALHVGGGGKGNKIKYNPVFMLRNKFSILGSKWYTQFLH